MLSLLLALACTPPSGEIDVDAPPASDDSATDSVDTGDSQPTPEPDLSVWLGGRSIAYDGCKDEVEEEGYQLDEDWEYYDYVQDECRDCTHFYVIEVWPDEACGLGVTTTAYRGLVFDGEDAEVWAFSQNGTSDLDTRASFDGMNIDYSYELYDGYVEIEGRVEFPEL
jgi:hypothetical protein